MYESFPHLELGKLVHNLLSELYNLILEIIDRHKCRINIGAAYQVTEEGGKLRTE